MRHLQVEVLPNAGPPHNWECRVADPGEPDTPVTPWLRTLGDLGADDFELVAVTPAGGRLWAFFRGPGVDEPLD